MPIYLLGKDLAFPDPSRAHSSGLLAVGGDLGSERLLLAYRKGIFPWYSEGEPILWYSPSPRFVLDPHTLHVPRTLSQTMRKRPFELRLDSDFEGVMRCCGQAPRRGQRGTWITAEMLEAYCTLHRLGYAHSAEAWVDGELVGGLYGVAIGRAFFGESMFARRSDASKVAFVALVRQLVRWGFALVDSQVYTEHVARFGGIEVPRVEYLRRLPLLLQGGPPPGAWTWDTVGPYGERSAEQV